MIALLVFMACGQSGQTTSTTAPTTPSTTGAPVTSEEVAAAFFEAWRTGDQATMESLAEPEALAQATELSDLATLDWQFDHCEGAAGTIFCVWKSDTDQLAIGVGNLEEPHRVTTVSLVDV